MRLFQTVSKRVSNVLASIAIVFPVALWVASGSSPALGQAATLSSGTLTLGSSSLRAGASTTVVATGVWSVVGGAPNGTITSSGVYTAPAVLPAGGSAVVSYVFGAQASTSTIQLLNPLPTISGTSVQTLTAAVTSLTVTGTGFVAQSQVMIGGAAVPTTFVDPSHLAATITVPLPSPATIALQVSNPAPGASTSAATNLTVAIAGNLTVSPATLPGGNISITLTYPAGIPKSPAVMFNGALWTITGQTPTTITASGYLAPWKTGSIPVALMSGSSQVSQVAVPITATAATFAAASRLAAQTGFGNRVDVMMHIQQIGLSAYIDEQEATTPDAYNIATENPRSHFMRVALSGTDQLRKRMGWVFQVLIPEAPSNSMAMLQPWETTMEAHAFGTFRQVLEDATSNSQTATLLTLPNNFASYGTGSHPNQNFGRELMQLFSLGTTLLNEDGTPVLDVNGVAQPTYTQDDVADASRALTGWTFPAPINPAFTYAGVDGSLPLVAYEPGHDNLSKTVLGVTFPGGQTALQDRTQLLDTIVNHPNTPPFVSRQLIQRLVKSNPSPAYVSRIVQVFKNDGTGVRGNLGAVIKAILLDPEARAGDTAGAASDGIVQEPLYQQLAAMGLLGITGFDDQPGFDPSNFKENWWLPNSVFSYFSPTYVVPGTSTVSPEFQLIDTITIVQRSQFMWGVVTGTATGIPGPPNTLFATYPNLTSMVDALNNILFHGAMPQSTHDAITTYCSTITDPTLQLQSAVFLALNSDNYNVVQ